VVDGGGVERVYAGGITRAATLSGGSEIVYSGGVASATTLSGGLVEIMSGGSIGGVPITFASGGTLQLDASMSFTGQIAGFTIPDALDLRDIAYTSGTTTESFAEAGSNTSGTLSVTSGTHSAHLTLLGSYVTSQFHLATDGHGGTLVTDPPVGGGTSQLLASAQDTAPVTFADIAPPPVTGAAAAPAPLPGTTSADNQASGAGSTLSATYPSGGISLQLMQTAQHNGLPPPS